MNMNSQEKCELMKSAITQLYSNEGRSFSYISRLFEINRKTVSDKIKEWNLPEPKPKRHMTPSNQKWLNAHRQQIKSLIDNDVSPGQIGRQLGKTRKQIYDTFIPADPVLKKAYEDYVNRIHNNHEISVSNHKNESKREYFKDDLPGEKWKDIVGYAGYQVSNKGRVRHYIKRYKSWIILKPAPNKNNGRLYISLQQDVPGKEGTRHRKKRKNLMLARVVAHAFVDGWSKEKNTVNHKDGDITNHESTNLEWTSQAENNLHAYRVLNRTKVNKKRYEFDYILYKNKYQFKTVAAFARFINMSETQTRRYLDNPDGHEIILVKNCND